jgi:acyl-CoA thioesterase I
MKKMIILSIILISAGILLFVLFKKENTTIKNYPPKNDTVVAFGDSLIRGVGATEGSDFISLLTKETGIPIENLGVPGDTTRLAINRIDNATNRDPGIVILLLGGNDALRGITKDETVKNLDFIIKKLQENGALVILLGIKGGLIDDPYKEMFEYLSKENGTFYVSNVLDGLFGKPKYMSDPIHPNNEGYKIISNRVLPILQKALGK